MADRTEMLLFLVDIQVRNAQALRALERDLDAMAARHERRLAELNRSYTELAAAQAAAQGGGERQRLGAVVPVRPPGEGQVQRTNLVGIRGPVNVGSRQNPFITAAESGTAAGLGGLAAKEAGAPAVPGQRAARTAEDVVAAKQDQKAQTDRIVDVFRTETQKQTTLLAATGGGGQGGQGGGPPVAVAPGGGGGQGQPPGAVGPTGPFLPGEMTVVIDRVQYAGLIAAIKEKPASRTTIINATGGGGGGGLPPVIAGGGGDQGGGGGGGGGGAGGFWSNLLGGFLGSRSVVHRGARVGIGPFGLPLPLVGAAPFSLAALGGLGLEHVLMTALGIAGSGVNALGGAGALGLGTVGKMAVGTGSDMAVMQTTLKNTQAIGKAYENLDKAVATYGKSSKQAQTAQAQLNYQLAELGGPNSPAVKAETALYKAADALAAFWQKSSIGAQGQSAQIMMQGIKLATDYVPMIAQAALKNLTIINQGLRPLFAWLEGPHGVAIFATLEANFARDLPTAVHAGSQALEGVLRVITLASSYTGGFVKTLDHMFTRLNNLSDAQIYQFIGRLVSEFKIWEAFIKAITTDLYLLFKQDAQTGQSIIQTLTVMLQKLGEWERSTRGAQQIHNIFQVHKDEVLALMQILPPLLSALTRIYLALAPPVTQALTVIAKAIGGVLNALNSLGPGVQTLLGLALISARLPFLRSALRTVAEAIGLVAAKKTETAMLTAAINAQTDAYLGNAAAAQRAAAAGAEFGAAQTAAMAGGGAAAAAGGGAAAAGVGAAEGGMLAGGVAGLTAKMKPLMKAGGLALGGILMGSIAQSLTGLKSNLGGTLGGGAIGAALGSLGGPIGTVIGAGIGATIGPTVAHALGKVLGLGAGEDRGKEFANGFIRQFQGLVPISIGQQIRRQVKRAYDEYQKALQSAGGGERADLTRGLLASTVNHAAIRKAGIEFGKELGRATVVGLQQIPYQSTAGIEIAFRRPIVDAIKKAGPAAGAGAADTMLRFAQGLISKGDLPKRAIADMLAWIRQQFPGLSKYLGTWGEGTSAQVAATFKFSKAQDNLVKMLGHARDDFGITKDYVAQTITAKNMFPSLDNAMAYFRDTVGGQTDKTKRQTLAHLDDLKTGTIDVFKAMTGVASTESGKAKAAVSSKTQGMVADERGKMVAFASNWVNAMGASGASTTKAMETILGQLNPMLHKLGAAKITGPQLAAAGAASQIAGSVQNVASKAVQNLFGAGARGAKIDKPMFLVGEEAPQHPEYVVPTNPAYRPRALGLFGQLGKELDIPGFQAGGRVQFSGPVSWFTGGATASGNPGGASVPGLSLRIPGTHWADARNRSLMGHVFRLSLQGHAGNFPDIDLGPADWTGKNIDVTAAAVRALGFSTNNFPTGAVGTVTELGPGAVISLGGAGAGAPTWTDIKAPKISGKGALGDIVRAAVGKVVSAANRYGQKKADALAAIMGAGGGSGPPPMTGKAAVDAMIREASAIASHNYPYSWGGGHNAAFAGPYDCSGAVSAVLHAAGLLGSPMVSGAFDAWGAAGPGKWVTLFSSPAHIFMEIAGRYFGTSGMNPGGGANWIPRFPESMPFVRHPPGLKRGGRLDPHTRDVIACLGHQSRMPPDLLKGETARLEDNPAAILPGLMRGGRLAWGGMFGNGGMMTVNQPTLAMFGERGEETAMFMPRFQAGGIIGTAAAKSTSQSHTISTTTPTGGGGHRTVTNTTTTTTRPTTAPQKSYHYDPLTGEIIYVTAAEWNKIDAEIQKTQHRLAAEKRKYQAWLSQLVTDTLKIGPLSVGAFSEQRRTMQREQLPLGGVISLIGPTAGPGSLARFPPTAWTHIVSALNAFLKITPLKELVTLSTTMAKALGAHPDQTGRPMQIENAIIKQLTTSLKTAPLEGRGGLLDLANRIAAKIGKRTDADSPFAKIESAIVNQAAIAMANVFTAQQDRFSKFQTITGALGNIRPGTNLGMSALQMRAMGMTAATAHQLMGGNTVAAAQARETFIRTTELPALKQDATRVEKLYKDALKAHNTKLANTLLGQLNDISQAEIQAYADLQQAITDKINAQVQVWQDRVTVLSNSAQTLQAFQQAGGTMGLSQNVLNALGLWPGAVGTGVGGVNALLGMQVGPLTDALNYLAANYAKLTPDQIQNMHSLAQTLAAIPGQIQQNLLQALQPLQDAVTTAGATTSIFQAIQGLNPGQSLATVGVGAAQLAAAGLPAWLTQFSGGGSLGYFQNLQSQQNGVLTPDQIAQATAGVGALNSFLQNEINNNLNELAGYQATLPSLSGANMTQAQATMQQLIGTILSLEGTLNQNNDSLSQLTKATNQNTATMTGSVTYSYQGQQYRASLSSDNPTNISVGG